MARDVLVDTSGLTAFADHRDPVRSAAERFVVKQVKSGARLVLTDYVIDKAFTLAKARAVSYGALRLLDIVEGSAGFWRIRIGEERFAEATAFFRKHADHGYSFTDCTSFILMHELKISDALTTDHHFDEVGFRPLLRTD